jgi:fatty-acid peroxygenase
MTGCPRHAQTPQHVLAERGGGALRAGYPYLLGLRRRWDAASIEIRLLGRRTTVVSGPDGAQLFYDESAMRRRGAVPRVLRRTLFGDGAIHGLDGDAHKRRKALFLDLLTPAAAKSIAESAAQWWRRVPRDPVVDPAAVFDDAVLVHSAAVCEWAGVPESRVDVTLCRDLADIVDGFGSLGPRGVRARRARKRVDRWACELVAAVRSATVDAVSGTALDVLAHHRDLDEDVAGVELINILRPTVAVAYFAAFAAHALGTHPGLRDRLQRATDEEYEAFAHEVRRHYPFVPMLGAVVRRRTSFHGRDLPIGRRVVLDVYGTLHDPDLWHEPARFDPDRFVGVEPDPYTYLPQGGGEPTGHRCPGERVAVELIKVVARHLVTERTPVISADERIPVNRLPTRPLPAASGASR